MAEARSKHSAGILLYRVTPAGEIEVLIGHMGGPFWSRKDAGAWTIPKGEYQPDGEDPLEAAKREFDEEIGQPVPATGFEPLGSVRQSGGKIVSVWAAAGDLDPATTVSGTFTMEWPPRSGELQAFPELDRTAWFPVDRARELIIRAQEDFLDRLVELVEGPASALPIEASPPG